MRNHIVVDSGCDVSKEFINCDTHSITHVPLNLQIEDKVYLDDENINLDEYMAHMEASATAVKSSAPSPSLFFESM